MDRLQFQPQAHEDVTALYERVATPDLRMTDQAVREAAWDEIAVALFGVLTVAETFGLAPIVRDTLDARLAGVAQAASHGQWIAFEAGLRVGTALAGLLGTSLN